MPGSSGVPVVRTDLPADESLQRVLFWQVTVSLNVQCDRVGERRQKASCRLVNTDWLARLINVCTRACVCVCGGGADVTHLAQEDKVLVCELRSGCDLGVGGIWETWWLSCAQQFLKSSWVTSSVPVWYL